ncbi:hypothetical protein E4T56_gene7786 [Termitomyces sp. T112]|nr:hypothetical protein E4T56_gene7786 [Termitomyces sp. T112]
MSSSSLSPSYCPSSLSSPPPLPTSSSSLSISPSASSCILSMCCHYLPSSSLFSSSSSVGVSFCLRFIPIFVKAPVFSRNFAIASDPSFDVPVPFILWACLHLGSSLLAMAKPPVGVFFFQSSLQVLSAFPFIRRLAFVIVV